jgi:hypothetical protein
VELKLKVKIQDNVCRKLYPSLYKGAAVGGIMMGDGLEVLAKYLDVKSKQGTGYNLLVNTFHPFYYLTNDIYGDAQLRLLCDDAKITSLKAVMSKRLLPLDTKYPIEHDALTEDGNPVLFCCLLDVPRLVRFKTGLTLHEKTGKVISFDFQQAALSEYLGDRVKHAILPFDKFTRLFFPDK